MPNRPPDHCPHCGDSLRVVDGPTVHRCETCDRMVFYNPTPVARVAVVDGESLSLNEIDAATVANLWETPGGAVEGSEDPDEAAARELREETGLHVAPDDLALFDASSFEKFPGSYKTRLCYAAARTDVTGTISVGDEPAAVRFWDRAAFQESSASLTDRQPAGKGSFDWWLDRARTAIDR